MSEKLWFTNTSLLQRPAGHRFFSPSSCFRRVDNKFGVWTVAPKGASFNSSVLRTQTGHGASWRDRCSPAARVSRTGKICLEKSACSWGNCFCVAEALLWRWMLTWLMPTSQWFAAEDQLILNYVWRLSYCPEHPDPRAVSTQLLD